VFTSPKVLEVLGIQGRVAGTSLLYKNFHLLPQQEEAKGSHIEDPSRSSRSSWLSVVFGVTVHYQRDGRECSVAKLSSVALASGGVAK
jgi:hypothetical protein